MQNNTQHPSSDKEVGAYSGRFLPETDTGEQELLRNITKETEVEKKKQKHPAKTLVTSTPVRVAQTLVLYAGFFSLGITGAIVGPTLLDLEERTGTDPGKSIWVLTAKCVGGMAGVLIAGVILRRANPWFLMALFQTSSAILLTLTPLPTSIIFTCALFAFHGVGRFFVDAGCNIMVLSIWGPLHRPWLQGLHACIGLGSFLGPLIAAPFISTGHRSDHRSGNRTIDGAIIDSLNHSQLDRESRVMDNATLMGDSAYGGHRIRFVYIIGGIILFVSGVLFMLPYLFRNRHPGIKTTTTHDETSKTTDMCQEKRNDDNFMAPVRKKKLVSLPHLLIVFVALFDFCLCLIVINYGSLVYTFAVRQLNWSKAAAVAVTSAYWFGLTGGQVLSVGLSKILPPKWLMMLIITPALVSSTLLLSLSGVHPFVLWATTIVLGIAMGPMFATSMSLLGSYITVGAPEGAILVFATVGGEMTGPILVASLYHTYGPMILVYELVMVHCVQLVLGLLILFVGRLVQATGTTTQQISQEHVPLKELQTEKAACGPGEAVSV